MDKVRLAVFGLNQGARTARDAVANEECELVAVAGFGAQAEEVARELQVPLYADYTELLANEELDAVVIALPNSLHVKAVDDSLAAGIKNILLEKPIANTVEEAEHIIQACANAEAILLVGHHRRSSAKHKFLKEIIESGRLGDIVGIQSMYAIAKPHDYFDVPWRVTKGGGPVLINAIHDFDDLNFVTGMTPEKVYATARNTIRNNEVEDSVTVMIDYKEGVTASYFISDGTPGPWSYDLAAGENAWFSFWIGANSMHVYGTKGSFGFPNMDLYYYDEDSYGWNKPLKHEHFDVETTDPMRAELAHFVDLCKGREKVAQCSGEDALATLKVITAIFDSIETGQVITLD